MTERKAQVEETVWLPDDRVAKLRALFKRRLVRMLVTSVVPRGSRGDEKARVVLWRIGEVRNTGGLSFEQRALLRIKEVWLMSRVGEVGKEDRVAAIEEILREMKQKAETNPAAAQVYDWLVTAQKADERTGLGVIRDLALGERMRREEIPVL